MIPIEDAPLADPAADSVREDLALACLVDPAKQAVPDYPMAPAAAHAAPIPAVDVD